MAMFSAPASADERLNWLRLARSEGVGPVTFRQLIQRFGSATDALTALPDLARRGGRARPLTGARPEDVAGELAALDRLGGELLTLGDAQYPRLLAAIEDAPPVLTVLGDATALSRRSVAMVGARNASLNGRRFAEKLARGLGQAGLSVVSGLARGIDGAAHAGSLETGTTAVVAGGVDVVYPPEHADLHGRVRETGAVVSEVPPGTYPTARHFPRRNRIISGLSLATVVVEAASRSGALITARMAAEQGRDVLAVPGSPADPRADGPNSLIRNGAVLVRSVEDILEALAPMDRGSLGENDAEPFDSGPPSTADPDAQSLQAARERLAESLSPVPTQVDELIRDCQLSASAVLTVLLELELAGRLERHPGHRVSLVSDPG